MSALNFNDFFILVIGFGFMQFDPQLTIKLSILFNFILDFKKLGPHTSPPFYNDFIIYLICEFLL